MDEQEIRRTLGRDLSAGTEGFRDALLARCLAVLGADGRPADLDDEELGLLAAAGSMLDFCEVPRPGDDGTGGT